MQNPNGKNSECTEPLFHFMKQYIKALTRVSQEKLISLPKNLEMRTVGEVMTV